MSMSAIPDAAAYAWGQLAKWRMRGCEKTLCQSGPGNRASCVIVTSVAGVSKDPQALACEWVSDQDQVILEVTEDSYISCSCNLTKTLTFECLEGGVASAEGHRCGDHSVPPA